AAIFPQDVDGTTGDQAEGGLFADPVEVLRRVCAPLFAALDLSGEARQPDPYLTWYAGHRRGGPRGLECSQPLGSQRAHRVLEPVMHPGPVDLLILGYLDQDFDL